MIALKSYQEQVLDTLGDFLMRCGKGASPAAAFEAAQRRAGFWPQPYLPINAPGLSPDMPYVCLRVPTGGGKTLLACHASGLAVHELIRAEHGVVLWLAPSTAIVEQTVAALRDPQHAYRRALDLACGPVAVMTVDEALGLSRAMVDGQTVVIVGTIQSFRVDKPEGRKVYEQNGALAEHLLNVPADRLADLAPGPDGKPVPSLVNVLRLRRPVVIMDEAHNARTDLTFSTFGQLGPSCIIEFTATPAHEKNPSNVLHRVSAAELKAEQMVKLPLRVVTRHPSQKDQLLAEALGLRADLEKLAGTEATRTGEYIRPILLLQAESVAACEPWRERLVKEFAIAKDWIAISTGAKDDLPDAKDLRLPKCPVRIVITVQKLREGWDCPDAYVLCSLKETRSAKDIEQIVGRILRLPGVTLKTQPDLNCSYAFSVSPSIAEVLGELRDALESNGFTAAEAAQSIIVQGQPALGLGVQPQRFTVAPDEIDETVVAVQIAALGGKVALDVKTGEAVVRVPLDDAEKATFKSCFKSGGAQTKAVEAVEKVISIDKAMGGSGRPRVPSGYELQLSFLVPLLAVREGKNLFEFGETYLTDIEWNLGDKDATLPVEYDPRKRPAGQEGVLDVGAQGAVSAQQVDSAPGSGFVTAVQQHALVLGGVGDWSVDTLVAWLDKNIRHLDIPVSQSAEFLRKAVRGLMATLGIDSPTPLAIDRYRLRDEIARKIDAHRDAERKSAYRRMLLPESPLVVGAERAIDFSKLDGYPAASLYEGGHKFLKHYFGPRPGELREKTEKGATTREFACAQYIDALPEVEFWFRNLAKRPSSFRLQTSDGWFYPDFVCKLVDGRILVVEYKGEHLFAGAEEKRTVGAVWASRSAGKCVFVMPEGDDLAAIDRAIRG